MSTGNVIYMIIVLGLVWGGFAYCLLLLALKRDAPDETR